MTTCSGTDEFEGATFVQASFKDSTIRCSDLRAVTVRESDCVRVILEEEWAHLRDIRRDLDLLG